MTDTITIDHHGHVAVVEIHRPPANYFDVDVCAKQVPDTVAERTLRQRNIAHMNLEGSGAVGMAGVGASSEAPLKLRGVADPGQRRHTRAERCSTSRRYSDHPGTVEGVQVFWEVGGVPGRTP
jgi:hypothetical protein